MILHIDGDAFFASCEQARNPALKGKPVITGQERGIASSMSYEAKAIGITRGMSLMEIKKICRNVIILPSDYEMYSLLSKRFYAIVKRYTGEIEEYGIDECFAQIEGYNNNLGLTDRQIAHKIQNDLSRELGVSFSIGLGVNKVIAKIGSKWKKPSGLTIINPEDIDQYLKDLSVEKIWGIGRQTTKLLENFGILTALSFKKQPQCWVQNNFSKPFYQIWQELNGYKVFTLETREKESYKSIQKFKTFTPASNNKSYIFSQLSKNIENACMKARRYHLISDNVFIILRTKNFQHSYIEIKLNKPTVFPHNIIEAIKEPFDKIFNTSELYRATGVNIVRLKKDCLSQTDIFGVYRVDNRLKNLFSGIDQMRKKYGKYTVFFGSSFQALTESSESNNRLVKTSRALNLFKGEGDRKHLAIPSMGEVF